MNEIVIGEDGIERQTLKDYTESAPQILFPPGGAELLASDFGLEARGFTFSARTFDDQVKFFVNEKPIEAAKQAAKNNIKIYTIGIGADEMIKRSFFGSRRVNPSADLDEGMLSEIAKLTKGQYFRARNQSDLEKIYQEINRLQPVDSEFLEFRPEKDLFYWPLSIAILILFSVVLLLKIRGEDEL